MKINKINIENFKSFQKNEINFGNINLLLGANSAGKSNFVLQFRLLKQIRKVGLSRAFAKYRLNEIKNFNLKERSFKIETDISLDEISILEKINYKSCIVKVSNKTLYSIEVYIKNQTDFEIREEIKFNEYFAEYTLENDEPIEEIKKLSTDLKYGIINNRGSFETFINNTDLKFYEMTNGQFFNVEIENPFHYKFISELNLKYKKKSILEFPGIFIPSDFFDFGIYDIEPKKAIKSQVENNDEFLDLESNGENLIQIINQILKDENKVIVNQFKADISRVLDFIEDIKVENFNGLLTLKIKEKDNKIYTDGHLLSDGTISIIALIVALYYQKNDIIFIEEPEHGIHPSLISQIVNKFYDVSKYKNKQIFITTHNPEILKNFYHKSGLSDLFLIIKENGVSKIEKPETKTMVNAFLEDEMGIDILFINNLLNN